MFKILPAWLCLCLFARMQKIMTAARIKAAPTIDPTTIPAIAPPERPDPDRAPPPDGAVEVAPGFDAVVEKTGGMEVVLGS